MSSIQHKNLIKLFLSCLIILFSTQSFAISQYKVKSGDSLWGIANDTKPSKSVNTKEMIEAIKGLNLEDYPNVVNNIVRTGQILSIPTSSQEVKDGISIYNAALLPGGYQPKITTEKEQITTTLKNNSNQSQLQLQNQKLVEENHQLRVAFKAYQENANASVNTLNAELASLQESNRGSMGWVIAIILLIVCLFLGYKNLSYRKLFNQTGSPTKPKEPNNTNDEDHSIEPTIFADDGPTINVNEALVEAMIMLEEGDKQGAKLCLQTALNDNPESIDVRIKLLEVYGAENDNVSFNSEKDYLSAHLLAHDDERWEEIDKIYQQYFVD